MMAGTPGAIRPGEAGPAAAAATAAASSVHLNCGGTNVDRTDSAGVVWLYDLPFIISPGPQQFAIGAPDSVSGIAAPLDQGDAAHVAMLGDMRFDTSSTLNAGVPGVLEYSVQIRGNFVYKLRVWGAEVSQSGNITGGRVTTISYDYGAGTTATLAQTFDLYGLADAYIKSAYLEQEFTITATGTQSLRLVFNGGGANDTNPLISAIEITGSAQSLVVPLGPSVGKKFSVGNVVNTQQGLRPPFVSGLRTLKGYAVNKGTKIVRSPATSGRAQVLGYTPMFRTGNLKSPTVGAVNTLGSAITINVPGFVSASPAPGRIIKYGGSPIARTRFPTQWTAQDSDSATGWGEYQPEVKWN